MRGIRTAGLRCAVAWFSLDHAEWLEGEMAESALLQSGFTAIMEFLVANGRAPHYTELSKELGISPSEARICCLSSSRLPAVSAGSANNTRYIGAWPPFSNSPTQYLISVDGERRWYGQCGLESLAFSSVFPGQEVQIDALTLTTADPVRVRLSRWGTAGGLP